MSAGRTHRTAICERGRTGIQRLVHVANAPRLAHRLLFSAVHAGDLMKPHHVLLITALSPLPILAARAQISPAPPSAAHGASPMGIPATYSSRISAVVYGPQGEVQALALRNGVAVSLPPDLGAQLQATLVKGARVQVSGTQRVIAGQTSLLALSLTANGQTIVAIQPPPPDSGPPAAPTPPGSASGSQGNRCQAWPWRTPAAGRWCSILRPSSASPTDVGRCHEIVEHRMHNLSPDTSGRKW